MTAHSSRSFLHSCLRVPIDPCNNCPAPVYNRPKMYLGRLTTTPMSVTTKPATSTTLKTIDYEMDAMLVSSGIRSLAKLYDSIPDYCDINHLPSEEFYSTLDTLRSTCCELRTKPIGPCIPEVNSTNSSASSRSALTDTRTKSKRTTGKKSHKNKATSKCRRHETRSTEGERSVPDTPCGLAHKVELIKRTRLKCLKEDFEDEVKSFKQTLKDYEAEFKQRASSVTPATNAAKTNIITNLNTAKSQKEQSHHLAEKQTQKRNATNFRKYLRKSLSVNDITSIADSKENIDLNTKPRLNKNFNLIKRDHAKLSSYFEQATAAKRETSSTTPEDVLPKITLESASSENPSSKSSSRTSAGRKKRAKHKKQQEQFKVPFTLFNLGAKKENFKLSTPSPVHPVARPNLAATLRAEVSKKKLKELQNNCTYYDGTTQFDWEVRKTPAWKSLSLNESHKEIIAIRLATRKAEQALQKREYELNMELMRQRVKSAPLLLEGTTFWGPNVGKLTHKCQREGTKHLCQHNQRRARSKSAGSRSRADVREETISECSHRSNKLNSLRKIYGGSAKTHTRNSQSLPSRRTPHSSRAQQTGTQRLQAPVEAANDSGDELSSLDRAFL